MKAEHIAWVIAIVLVFGFLSPPASAPSHPEYIGNGLVQSPIHSNDYYVVSFDGEGDAVVSVKLILYNNSDANLQKVNLEIEGNAKLYKAVQESAGDYYPCQYGPCPMGVESEIAYPDYYPYTNFAQKIDASVSYTSTSTLVTLPLPVNVPPQGSTAIVLLYKVSQYAQKDSLGVFHADFKTIVDRDAALVQNIRVALNAPQDWSIKGGTAKVDYRPELFGASASAELGSAKVDSAVYREFSNQIAYASGAIVKNAQNLDPLESFHVKAEYAENSWQLYFWELFAAIVAIVIVIALTIAGAKQRRKNAKPKTENIGFGIFAQAALQAFGIVALWEIVLYVIFNGYSLFGSAYYNFSTLLLLLVGILAFVLSGLALFGPCYLTGKKEGFKAGAIQLIVVCVFLLVFWMVWLFVKAMLWPPSYDTVTRMI